MTVYKNGCGGRNRTFKNLSLTRVRTLNKCLCLPISPPHSSLLLFSFLNQFHLLLQSIFRQFSSSFIQFLNNLIYTFSVTIDCNKFIILTHDKRLARFIALIILVTPIPPPNRGIKSCARNSLSSSSTLSLPNRLNNNSAYPPSDMV